MIKFQCIDEQHAKIAASAMRGADRKTVLLGRAVISEGEWTDEVIRIAHQNMSHTLSPTKYDKSMLKREGTV